MIKYFLALLFSSSLLFSATEVVNVINIDYYIGPCEAVTTDFAAAEASCLARYPDVTYQPLAASTALALDPDYNATSYLSAPSFELDTSYVVSSAWKNSYHNRIYVYMATNKAYNFYYVAPPENCNPFPNTYLESTTNTCECNPNYSIYNNVCSIDTDDNGLPDIIDPDADIDGDGISNSIDLDDDGDGIPDNVDSDHPNYNPIMDDSSCGVVSIEPLFKSGSIIYSFSDYTYKGILNSSECNNLLLGSDVDSILLQPDKKTGCDGTYCYAHYIKTNCSFIPEVYKPSSDYVYKSYNASICDSKVDGINYSASSYILPDSTNCPTTGFCFLLPIKDSIPENNQTAPPDLNSTSVDLAPLLKAQEDTNLNLDDIKNKLDSSNLSLEEIAKSSGDLLTSNQDFKKSFDSFSLKTGTFQQDILGQAKKTTDNLNTINQNVVTSNKHLQSISSTNSKIVDSLLADIGPDVLATGSDSFSGYQSTVTDSFSSFVDSNVFGFANQAYTVPTVSFDMWGHTFVLFSPSLLSNIDIASIRSMLLFVFALAGFISVFRTI